jgi:hypothetical protein
MKIEISEGIGTSIKEIVKKTNLFKDEKDFVEQAIIKQISKFRNI